jgi:hypothetical protein
MKIAVFGKKGIAKWIADVLAAFVAIGITAFLYFLLIGRYFDIQGVVVSSEAQRHTIGMAQILLSSDKLVYEESFGNGMKRYYRGIFDKDKLDEQMISKQDETKESELAKEISYPNTATQIVVTDISSSSNWVLSFNGPNFEGEGNFQTCMWDSIDWNILVWPFNIPAGPWNMWDIATCALTYTTKVGVFEKDFPVLIKVGDELHAGRLFVRIMGL